MRAYILVDLGFGDAGKGLLTDFLARRTGAGLVVRYNGGAQAGHNVVTPEGLHHTFSQFGSASLLPEVRTYLSRFMVIHPGALLQEGAALKRKGVKDCYERLRISDQALLITPFHQAANRIREIVRGQQRHGSCGVGVGEAVADARDHPGEQVTAADLFDQPRLSKKLGRVRERKIEELAPLGGERKSDPILDNEFNLLEGKDIIPNWLEMIAPVGEMGLVARDETLALWLKGSEATIFEGAQGVLLDADHGFHPYTTWSDCTDSQAVDLLDALEFPGQVIRLGVLREHVVRHGPGPLPTETREFSSLIQENNTYNEWQGKVRYGWFDAVLARYALEMNAGVDGLVLTHLDLAERRGSWACCTGYANGTDFSCLFSAGDHDGGPISALPCLKGNDLGKRNLLTEALFRAKPIVEHQFGRSDEVVGKINDLLGQRVWAVSYGPCATNVKMMGNFL